MNCHTLVAIVSVVLGLVLITALLRRPKTDIPDPEVDSRRLAWIETTRPTVVHNSVLDQWGVTNVAGRLIGKGRTVREAISDAMLREVAP